MAQCKKFSVYRVSKSVNSVNSVSGLFRAVFQARSLASGRRLVYDIFSTHSKEIA
jgi:hypothetical protein